ALVSTSPGEYYTCLAEGYVRIHTLGDNEIATFDVEGDASDGFVDTIATIVERILLTSTSLTEDDLDAVDFANFETAHSYEIGFWSGVDDNNRVSDVVARLLGFGKWGQFTRDDKFSIGLFQAPSGAPRLRLDWTDYETVEPVELPDGLNPP